MKKILSTLALILLAIGAQAQNAYPLFAPSNGIMRGDVNTFVTASATGADVTALFSGTCNATAFLRGDASCFDLFAAANTWSATQSFTSNGANARFNGADPRFLLNETDGGVDEKNWLVRSVASSFNVSTSTDASPFSAINSAINVARSGTAVGQITLSAPNATVVMTGSGGVSGTVGNSGLTAISGVTSSGQILNNDSNPSYYINESDAAADEKLWRQNGAAGDLVWSTRTDANGGGATFFSATRTGTTVDSLSLTATTINLNGVASTDFARLSQSNTFTASINQFTNTGGPRLVLRDTDAAADTQCFFALSQSSQFDLYASTDANCTTTTGAESFFQATRTGAVINDVRFPNGTVRVNTPDSPSVVVGPTIANITSRSGGTSLIAPFQVNGSAATESTTSFTRANGANSAGPILFLNKSRGTIAAPTTIVVADDDIGRLVFSGSDSANFTNGAEIAAQVDGTPGAGDMPGRLVFSTTADGASVPTERLRIAANGAWGLAGATFGAAGNVLTSNGSGTAPTWTAAASGDAVLANNQTFTGQNTFSNGTAPIRITGPLFELDNNAPIVQIDEADGAANERNTLIRSAAGLFAISTALDASPTTPSQNLIEANRTGATYDTFTMQAPSANQIGVRGNAAGASAVNGIAFITNADVRTGFVGDGSGSSSDIFLTADTASANIKLNPGSGGTVQANDIPILGRDAASSASVVRVVSAQLKGGNTDRTSTTTLAADPTLTGLSIPETGSYYIEGHLCFVGPVSGAGGIRFRYEFSGSVGSASLGKYMGSVNAVVVANGNFLALDANFISFATITTGSGGDCIQFDHTMTTTGSGTLDLQWAQNTSNANAIRLLAGSMIKVTRIG